MRRILSTACFAVGMICLSLAFSRTALSDTFGFCTPRPCGTVPQNGLYCCGGTNEYGMCQSIPGPGCNLGPFSCNGTLRQFWSSTQGCFGAIYGSCSVPHNDNCGGHNY